MQVTCKYCGKTMGSAWEYFIHYTRECQHMPKTRRCPVCGARFPSFRLLKVHLMNEALVDNRHRGLLTAKFS
ncbi:MAG: C2H2-type zinc finger protein [Caldivirga sp.]|jgi:transcription elongation factor Elf1|uniref:C2H2-type zinc finger protein n=1 Tax=Caldivirga sp. MU80 TaxID=1650354 RepID=UPI000829CAFB|nr:C2H2-type zinc finger protein [Caldivirga sp. MU80]MDT7903003.1 C2H2-type zinc finger protein [Caldivirga sp.]